MSIGCTTFRLSRFAVFGAGIFLVTVPAIGQSKDAPLQNAVQSHDPLSLECRVPAALLYSLAPLRRVRAAVEQKHRLNVLALGPTSSSAHGQGTGLAAYPVRLEHELEKVLPGVDVVVEARSLPGEIAAQAEADIMSVVSEVEPELIVWQVGISDALAQTDVAAFSEALDELLRFFRAHSIDAVLVDPPYTAAMATDEHFTKLVAAIGDRAHENAVALIRRSAAMRFLSEHTEAGQSRFSLHNRGYHCTAEYVAFVVRLSTERFGDAK